MWKAKTKEDDKEEIRYFIAPKTTEKTDEIVVIDSSETEEEESIDTPEINIEDAKVTTKT